MEAEITNEIDEIGARVDPIVKIRDRDETRGVHMRMRTLDDHVARGIHVDTRRVARVGIHEPDDDRDVVGDALKRHWDCAFSLEEIDGTTVVVSEGGGFGI